MESNLLSTLCSAEFFQDNRERIRADIFSTKQKQSVFNLISDAQKRYETDLTPPDLLALWKAQNPTATEASYAAMAEEIQEVTNSLPLTQTVARDVIQELWQQEVGREIAELGIKISEGQVDGMRLLKDLVARTDQNFVIDDYGDPTTDDLDLLLAEVSNDNRWSFNITTLNRRLYGIGPTDFYIVAARPETGKTAFLASICAAPLGFCWQGAKVLWIGNEEATTKVKLRAYQSCTGLTKEAIPQNKEFARSEYAKIRDNLIMKDTQDWDLEKIEGYIRKINPNIVILDQADKINISGSFPSTHEKIRELYRQLREVAKRHYCGVIAVCQAGLTAEGRTRVDFSDLENSRTGKAAECDVCIGIGLQPVPEGQDPDYTRFLTISKNKVSGWHGMIACELQHEISRYVE